ncbi:hypothetical protein, unlikely [Trypanosoma brucei gambiense DAL972]|uniref:Uncharacterized protein n=1 Tax=Trypanosoma brucei gambiense (strain MHOM/CI/86/DAL972) TaxID=679716 RepID=D0A510_TRYB9|nr:hypothetical protein, unlikely [Trypanosoma brucei gambiense DAL972]CBH16354.1 hypothetical protein, unlikely [Trypanosoma brucei gambiense DAL972]|eukprot:XP_011778618.1 hypothetical protein, unlikely [Trypanosoma brucei gambiense DAL972]
MKQKEGNMSIWLQVYDSVGGMRWLRGVEEIGILRKSELMERMVKDCGGFRMVLLMKRKSFYPPPAVPDWVCGFCFVLFCSDISFPSLPFPSLPLLIYTNLEGERSVFEDVMPPLVLLHATHG